MSRKALYSHMRISRIPLRMSLSLSQKLASSSTKHSVGTDEAETETEKHCDLHRPATFIVGLEQARLLLLSHAKCMYALQGLEL